MAGRSSGGSQGVQFMFSLDMTGEDTAKVGGTFLIEKRPDPSAVWERPSDPHSEWGASEIKPETLKGSLLNDLHLAACQHRARTTGWVVREALDSVRRLPVRGAPFALRARITRAKTRLGS